MRKITFSQATQEAMAETMAKDPTVFAMGEDLARQGGIFGQFKGLPQQFPGRIIDTPISETFIIGGGVGAALAGAVRGGHALRRLHRRAHGRDLQPDGKGPLHVRRPGQGAPGPACARRFCRRRRCTAFPVRGVLVRPHPRHQGCGALQSL